MLDFFTLIETYGPAAGVLVIMITILIPVVNWLNKLDTKIKKHSHILEEVKEDIGAVHDRCHVPTGAVKKLEEKVTALELQDARFDGDLRTMNSSLGEIQKDVKRFEQEKKDLIKNIDDVLLFQSEDKEKFAILRDDIISNYNKLRND